MMLYMHTLLLIAGSDYLFTAHFHMFNHDEVRECFGVSTTSNSDSVERTFFVNVSSTSSNGALIEYQPSVAIVTIVECKSTRTTLYALSITSRDKACSAHPPVQ